MLFRSLCFLLAPSVVFADVTGFIFITPSQTILPNTLSGPITIQAQNVSGVRELTAETTDLTFTSTSATGQFLSSTGKVVSKTMAKGSANRTFYYSDTTLGPYTLTLTATGRTSKQSFSASQQIIVASVLPAKPTPIIKSFSKTTVKASTKPKATKITSSPITNASPNSDFLQNETASSSIMNTASVYEATAQTSMFDSLFDWPKMFWNWLVHIF